MGVHSDISVFEKSVWIFIFVFEYTYAYTSLCASVRVCAEEKGVTEYTIPDGVVSKCESM